MDPTVSTNNKKSIRYLFFLKYIGNNEYQYVDPLRSIKTYVNYLDSKYTKTKLKTLTDHENYHKIKSLEIDGHELSYLPDKLPNNLEYFSCMNNLFTKLPPLPNKLKYLDISGNPVRELPESLPDTLEELHIGYTQISKLPSRLPSRLKILCCTGSPLQEEEINKYQVAKFEFWFHKNIKSKYSNTDCINIFKTYIAPKKPSLQTLETPQTLHNEFPKKKNRNKMNKIVKLEVTQLDMDIVDASDTTNSEDSMDNEFLKKKKNISLDTSVADIISLKPKNDEPPDNWDSSDNE